MANDFQHQIKNLMYSFGDVKNPSPESAELVEEFTRQQTQELVKGASRVASMRDDRVIRIEDIMFILRKDKAHLRRLIQFLDVRALTKKAKNRMEDDEYHEETESKDAGPQACIKRLKLSIDFLTPLQIAELRLGEPDQLTAQRLERQDEITNSMSSKEYQEYTEHRFVSLHRNLVKFKEWIGFEELTTLKFNPDVFDVIGHLANETIKKLVELSVQVKADMSSHNPRQLQTNHSSIGASPSVSDPPCTDNEDTQTTGSGSFVLGSPPLSPPANNLTSPDTDGVSITASSLRRSSRGVRKRQRGSQAVPVLAEVDSVMEELPQTVSVWKSTSKAIRPVHIREAMRRLSLTESKVSPLWTHHSGIKGQPKSWCL